MYTLLWNVYYIHICAYRYAKIRVYDRCSMKIIVKCLILKKTHILTSYDDDGGVIYLH